jgi:hypothetical protein
MVESYQEALEALTEAQNSYQLSIIRISEPISSSLSQAIGARTSDISNEGLDILTPTSLETDLSHYKVAYTVFWLNTIDFIRRNYSRS